MFKKFFAFGFVVVVLSGSSAYAAMDLIVDSAEDLKELYDDGVFTKSSGDYAASKKAVERSILKDGGRSVDGVMPAPRKISIFDDASDFDAAASGLVDSKLDDGDDLYREAEVLRVVAQAPDAPAVDIDPGKLQGVVFVQNEQMILDPRVRTVYKQVWDTEGAVIQAIGLSSGVLKDALFDAGDDLAPYLGSPISIELIDEVIGVVKHAVRTGDIPFANVYSPPQKIQDGIVYLVVNPSLVDDVRIAKSQYYNEERLLGKISQKIGEPINVDVLNHELAALSLHPDRRVNAAFSTGDIANSTTIDLDIYEQKPWRVYAALFNSGSADLDKRNVSYGGYHNNLWGIDHKASYQYTSSVDRESLKAHNLSYEVPLFGAHSVLFQYSKSDTQVSVLAGSFETEGAFSQRSVHYQAALFDQLKWGDGWALSDHNVSFGVDNKDIKGDILFTLFGDPISTGVGSDVEVINAVLGYEGQLADPFGGETTISTSMVYSPGGLSARNRGDNFLTARSDVDAEYMYARFSAKRSQPTSWNFLGKDMTFLAGAEGQVSADRLIGSERFVNFNRQGFRGYNSGVMSGDSGLANFVELETGSYSLMPTKYWEDSVKASVFADFGVFYDNDPQGEEGREGYLSVGASLNYRINDQIDSELTFSHALSGQGDSDDEQAVMYKMLFGY